MDGLLLRLNLMALLGLFLAAPVALLNLLVGYLPGALAWGVAATLCAGFLGVQLVIWGRRQTTAEGRHSMNRVRD